jgi:predicted permease
VVAQFALAVALVAVATALGAELQRSLTADPGFERERVLTAVFDAASAGYDQKATPALLERMRETALGLPGVQSVGFSASGILAGSQSSSGIFMRDPQARVQQGEFQHDSISPGYFGVTGVTMLRGRDLTESDKEGAPRVVVVSAAFARQVFGDRDPIGQRIGTDPTSTKDDRTIVGVVADVKMNGVREQVPPMFYTTLAQPMDADPHFLAVRFAGPAAALQTNLQAALARLEPGLVLTSWKTLQDRMESDLSGDLATTRLAEIFGGCAILLAGAGIAGSLGYLVILRQRELALRMAIGASPGQVLRSVLEDSLRLGLIGAAVGVAVAWLLPMLPAVRAVLSAPPGIVPALVAAMIALVTALVAGWIPARRASRIDPILMLKAE